MRIRHLAISYIVACTMVFLAPTSDAGSNIQSINWNADSINWSQLTNLISQNAGVDQFAIKFPNQTTWNVAPAQLQQIHNTYIQKAQAMGLNTNKIPELSFSSAIKAGGSSLFGSLPVQSFVNTNQLDQTIGTLLNKDKLKNYQAINLGDSFPKWLNDLVNTIYIGILNICEYFHSILLSFSHSKPGK